MNGVPPSPLSKTHTQTLRKRSHGLNEMKTSSPECSKDETAASWLAKASFMRWRMEDISGVARYHPVRCFFAACVLFCMGVEYTLRMIAASSPPFDLGFVVTGHLNRLLAGLNTVFVGMQTAYMVGAFLLEGRARATTAAVFMFTCRCQIARICYLCLRICWARESTFRSGMCHFSIPAMWRRQSVIASVDMKRMQRWEWSWAFDTLNFLQVVMQLSTRGHYTIDLAVGIGSGLLFIPWPGSTWRAR